MDGVEYPVKVIRGNAFAGNPWLIYIAFGEGIEVIEINAVARCNSLIEISLPSTLKTFYGGFESCGRVKSLILPSGLKTLYSSFLYGLKALTGTLVLPSKLTTVIEGDSTGAQSIYFDGFEISTTNPYFKTVDGCWFSKDGTKLYAVPTSSSWLSSYTIPDTVTDVANVCFYSVVSLTELTFGANVVDADGVITYLPNLRTLYLNAKLTMNPFSPFCDLQKLEEVVVEEGSTTFSSDANGLLYNADKTTLILVPCGKPYDQLTFANTVTHIERRACVYLKVGSVVLHEGLLGIGVHAFFGIRGLSGTTNCGPCQIPSTLRTVNTGAFLISRFTKFEVASSNSYFSSDGGYALYNKDKTRLVAFTYPENVVVDYECPSTVTSTNNTIFSENSRYIRVLDFSKSQITSLAQHVGCAGHEDAQLLLPETLIYIQSSAILSNVKTLTIPASVTTIRDSAFFLYDRVEELIFLNPGTFTAGSIFGRVPRSLVIKGYKGSSAEAIALRYTLRFKPLD